MLHPPYGADFKGSGIDLFTALEYVELSTTAADIDMYMRGIREVVLDRIVDDLCFGLTRNDYYVHPDLIFYFLYDLIPVLSFPQGGGGTGHHISNLVKVYKDLERLHKADETLPCFIGESSLKEHITSQAERKADILQPFEEPFISRLDNIGDLKADRIGSYVNGCKFQKRYYFAKNRTYWSPKEILKLLSP